MHLHDLQKHWLRPVRHCKPVSKGAASADTAATHFTPVQVGFYSSDQVRHAQE